MRRLDMYFNLLMNFAHFWRNNSRGPSPISPSMQSGRTNDENTHLATVQQSYYIPCKSKLTISPGFDFIHNKRSKLFCPTTSVQSIGQIHHFKVILICFFVFFFLHVHTSSDKYHHIHFISQALLSCRDGKCSLRDDLLQLLTQLIIILSLIRL